MLRIRAFSAETKV